MSVRRPIRFAFGLLLGILLVPGADAAHETKPPACPAYRNVPEDRSPHVSRDGTTLAWTREFPRGGVRALVSGADGSRPRRMDPQGVLSELSPDGREALLIEERSRRGEWTSLHYLANTATGDARRISESELTAIRRLWRTPEWSPDGRFYVEVDTGDPYYRELWLFPADGGPGLRLFRPAEEFSQLFSPTWSPDGNTIAFLSRSKNGDDYSSAVWTVRPDGTGARQTTKTYDTYDLAWSPNGRLLAFAEDGAADHEPARIGVVRPDGSGFRWLTRPHYAYGGQSSWSPAWLNDERLVYEARRWSGYAIGNRVVVLHSVRVDGTGERRITYHCHLGHPGRDAFRASHLADVVKTFGGDDVVFAGPGDDDVDLGPGADKVFAGSGRDLVRARDGERDRVSCGPGCDVAFLDPNDRAVACERIRRRHR